MLRQYNRSNDENFIISPVLTKFTFLYQIVDDNCSRLLGRNVFHVTGTIMIAYTVFLVILGTSGLYYWANDTTQFAMNLVVLGSFLFGSFKLFVIIGRWKDVRRCMKLARMDFVFADSQSTTARHTLQTHRALSSKFIVWFMVINYFVLFTWSVLPFLFSGKHVEIKNLDGSHSKYRFSAMNLYFLVSDETYNLYHLTFHLLELLIALFFLQSMVLFDTFMVTMGITIIGQLRVISDAYKRLGQTITTIDLNGECSVYTFL